LPNENGITPELEKTPNVVRSYHRCFIHGFDSICL